MSVRSRRIKSPSNAPGSPMDSLMRNCWAGSMRVRLRTRPHGKASQLAALVVTSQHDDEPIAYRPLVNPDGTPISVAHAAAAIHQKLRAMGRL